MASQEDVRPRRDEQRHEEGVRPRLTPEGSADPEDDAAPALYAVASPGFSVTALATHAASVEAYSEALAALSRQCADIHGVRTVDEVHVERAAAMLFSPPPRRLVRHLGTIGGVLFGGCLSGVTSMASVESFPAPLSVASLLAGASGLVMITIHALKN